MTEKRNLALEPEEDDEHTTPSAAAPLRREATPPTNDAPLATSSPGHAPSGARTPGAQSGAPSGLRSSPRSSGDPLIGKVLDHRYRLVQLLARGGMGRVYRAEQAPLHRIVAVKVLEGATEQDQEFRERFIREAGACARLTHPNTIRIFDYGNTWDDIHYIAMEHLEGRNLHAAIRSDAPMDPARVVQIATQVCGSLREAHQLGLIHRDLKPSNVMLVAHGGEPEFVKVLDFGLVKELRDQQEITRRDAVVGSPSYMSPEQIRASPVDARSDIYSLGVMLFACLTGRTPFSGATSVNVLMAHLSQPVPSLREANAGSKAGPVLEWIVRTCLAKAPEDRFASTDELRKALSLAAQEAAGHPTPVPRVIDGRVVGTDLTSVPGAWTPPSMSRAEVPAPPEVTVPAAPSSSSNTRLPAEPSRSRSVVLPWGLLLLGLGIGLALLLGIVGFVAWQGLRPAGSAPAAPPPAVVTGASTPAAGSAATGSAPDGTAATVSPDAVPGVPPGAAPAAQAAATAPVPAATSSAPARTTSASSTGRSSPASGGSPARSTSTTSSSAAASSPASPASASTSESPAGTTAASTTAASPSSTPPPASSTAPAEPASSPSSSPASSPTRPSDLRDPWKAP